MRGQVRTSHKRDIGLRVFHGLLVALTMFAYLKTVELLPADMTAPRSFIALGGLAAVFFAPLALVLRWMNRSFGKERPTRSP